MLYCYILTQAQCGRNAVLLYTQVQCGHNAVLLYSSIVWSCNPVLLYTQTQCVCHERRMRSSRSHHNRSSMLQAYLPSTLLCLFFCRKKILKDLYYFLIKFIHAVVFKRGKLKHAGGRAFVLQVGIKCTCSCT